MNRVTDIVLPREDINDLRVALGKDKDSIDLLRQIVRYFNDRLKLEPGEEAALNRLLNTLASCEDWKNVPGLLRNNTFKVANSLGIDLPSQMF